MKKESTHCGFCGLIADLLKKLPLIVGLSLALLAGYCICYFGEPTLVITVESHAGDKIASIFSKHIFLHDLPFNTEAWGGSSVKYNKGIAYSSNNPFDYATIQVAEEKKP